MLTEGGKQQFCADDLADRLSRRYSVLILIMFAVLITMHTYIGEPITCWAPAQFTSNHVRYANSLCWVRNTYYIPFEQRIPFQEATTVGTDIGTGGYGSRGVKEQPRELLYYQWFPFIFLIQALFFHFPNIVWRGMNSKAGIDADHILEAARAVRKAASYENQRLIIGLVANQIKRLVVNRASVGKRCAVSLRTIFELACSCCCGKRFGNYIFLIFVIVKILYFLNALAQLFIIGSVLGTNYSNFGWDMLTTALSEETLWANDVYGNMSTIFPRVTLCDVYVRRLGTMQRFTLQCVLPMNLYAETMFAFLWVWIVFVMLFSIYGAVLWFTRLFPLSHRMHFTYVLLKAEKQINSNSNQDYLLCEKFVDEYLKLDGVLLLMLIEDNTGSVTSAEVAAAIWKSWPALSTDAQTNTYTRPRRPRRIAPSAPPKSDPSACTVPKPEKPALVTPPAVPPRPKSAPPAPPKPQRVASTPPKPGEPPVTPPKPKSSPKSD